MKKKSLVKKNKKEMSIDDLAGMVQRGFTVTATKDDLKDFVTKEELKEELKELKNDLEVMMGRHIGTFRKDYDELARRVRKLEDKVFSGR